METVVIYPGFSVMLEVFLIGLLIALIGAGGYTFFIYSMHYDRNAQRRSMSVSSPWDTLNAHNEEETQKPGRSNPHKVIMIAVLAVIVILILFILALLLGWITI